MANVFISVVELRLMKRRIEWDRLILYAGMKPGYEQCVDGPTVEEGAPECSAKAYR